MNWKQLRIPLLVLICANVLFVFGRSILDPSIGKRTVKPFVFPSVVPLLQWQFVASQPLENKTLERQRLDKSVAPSRHYRYIQNGLPLDIKMRYQVQTNGNVLQFIRSYTPIKLPISQQLLTVREQEQIGFYGLFVHDKRAYLDACINPHGGSTFTKEQFSYNRIHYDVQFNRLLPWLLGQQKLLDKRCLWTHLSIPLNQSSPQSAYATLENAWFSWYQWWRPRFPKP